MSVQNAAVMRLNIPAWNSESGGGFQAGISASQSCKDRQRHNDKEKRHIEIIEAFTHGEIDVLIGTQMIAKGSIFKMLRLSEF